MPSKTPRIDSLNSAQNLIINGGFDFWQRGSSFPSASGYTADRWSYSSSGYTATVARSTDVPTVAQSGYQSKYSLLITNGTGASPTAAQFQEVFYKMEGLDYQQLHGKPGRVQFWIKSSVAGTYPCTVANGASNRSYVQSFTITSANTWQKIALDLTFDSSGTWNFDNTIGMFLIIAPTMGSTFQTSALNAWQSANLQGLTGQTQWGATTGATLNLAQVQIIPGSFSSDADVPFRRAGKTIRDELAMCQRYYEKSYNVGTNPGQTWPQSAPNMVSTSLNLPSAATDFMAATFRVAKRANPAIVVYDTNGIVNQVDRSVNSAAITNVALTTAFTVNLVGENSFGLRTVSGTAGNNHYYAFHYTADAEL